MKTGPSVTKLVVAACLVLGGMVESVWGQAKAAARKPAAGPKTIAVDLGGGVKMQMTLIPAGEFMMGSRETAEATAKAFNDLYGWNRAGKAYFDEEHPQHRVRITRPFYLGTFHVTRGQFRRFVTETGYKTRAEKDAKPGWYGWNEETHRNQFNESYTWLKVGFEQTDEHPVVCISWTDAVAFCEWLSKKEGKTYRLPTEAEWEYACRAGTTTRYYSGDDPETLVKVGNVPDASYAAKFPGTGYALKADDGYAVTAPVGKFQPNAFGLYDMHGNAEQWCADRWVMEYYRKSPTVDPLGPDSGPLRVVRGGSWSDEPHMARSCARYCGAPRNHYRSIGFRVARTE